MASSMHWRMTAVVACRLATRLKHLSIIFQGFAFTFNNSTTVSDHSIIPEIATGTRRLLPACDEQAIAQFDWIHTIKSKTMQIVLQDLPLDILLGVLRFLAVADILHLQQTSRSLLALTRERSVWFNALHLQVVEKGFPVPHLGERTIASLSASELEYLTKGALRLHKNWTSDSPVPTRHIQLMPVPAVQNRRPRVLALYTLPGRGNKYLVSITVEDQTTRPRNYNIDFWNVIASSQRPVARYTCINLFSAAINADPLHPCVVVVTHRAAAQLDSESDYTATALGIDFSVQDPHSAIQTFITFRTVKHAVALKGSIFLATEESHHIRVFHVSTGTLQYILRTPLVDGDATLQLDEFRCLNCLILDSYILVFRQQWIHLYALPSVQATTSLVAPQDVAPVAAYSWLSRIDTLIVSRHRKHPLLSQFRSSIAHSNNTPTPLCLLLRLDSWFPWPVNILHQFILPVNTLYDANVDNAATQSIGLRPAMTMQLPYLHPLSGYSSATEASNATPSHLKPYMVSSIPSPLRIFTPSDTVLGAYGTAMWLDAQTHAAVPTQAGDRGQRIAAKALRFMPPSQPVDAALPLHAVDIELGAGSSYGGFTEEDLRDRVNVFCMQEENDDWDKLAVCDGEGWIAIGCTDGRILVYDYA